MVTIFSFDHMTGENREYSQANFWGHSRLILQPQGTTHTLPPPSPLPNALDKSWIRPRKLMPFVIDSYLCFRVSRNNRYASFPLRDDPDIICSYLSWLHQAILPYPLQTAAQISLWS